MRSLAEVFAEKNIRAIWDEGSGKWWFSTVDICAVILECDRKTARKYLAWLRGKWIANNHQLASVTRRLNFPAENNRAHFTDAMDYKDILRLIMAFPSPKAEPLRMWLAELLTDNTMVAEQFAEIGTKSHNIHVKDALLKTITRKKIFPEE